MPIFIIYGNLGQPSAYLTLVKAKDQVEAVRRTVKQYGRGFRCIHTKETCPPKLKLILQRMLDNNEEMYLSYSDFMRVTDGHGSVFKY
jgi:hypothetical protein